MSATTSSMTELSFHGIATLALPVQGEGVTHVSGTKRHPRLGSVTGPSLSRVSVDSQRSLETAGDGFLSHHTALNCTRSP